MCVGCGPLRQVMLLRSSEVGSCEELCTVFSPAGHIGTLLLLLLFAAVALSVGCETDEAVLC